MVFTVSCYHILYGLIFLWFCVCVSFFHHKNSTDGCWRGEVNWRMVWTKYSCSSTKVSEIIPVSFRTYSPGAAKIRPRQSFEGCISHCPTVRNVLAIYLQVQHGIRCWSSVSRYWVGNGWALNFNKGRAWGKETAGRSLLLCHLHALTSHTTDVYSFLHSGTAPAGQECHHVGQSGGVKHQREAISAEEGTELQFLPFWAAVLPARLLYKDGQLLIVWEPHLKELKLLSSPGVHGGVLPQAEARLQVLRAQQQVFDVLEQTHDLKREGRWSMPWTPDLSWPSFSWCSAHTQFFLA